MTDDTKDTLFLVAMVVGTGLAFLGAAVLVGLCARWLVTP